ncbi:PIKK family atypical protein kinase [Trichomonas vaginalis G3]|uniref:Serine/threonine-protein kinase TOR n=1 Tax=Trichomonas vaginalis (strain ATCC PRA-98 / G3) TaxID=412133 RepID=A2F1S9_TRIV3|nr:ataxia telangiectasia mutated (ATM) -related family [Trichomonas vaginalis G3]EAY01129.1 PIKK family atypical protein kinase [Trichomonas vaginalis G3]KAI5540532.1 ataxia telangiectasia mutated (ATM) -related family [Trichomonas vaginalis G3]|eukprot:XP_001313981.1 PIKK family atypical protein kinase [Trichomonas vaginalis G3]
MERVSNNNFNKYIDDFFEILSNLSKEPIVEDSMRTAIGILSLHSFGFPDFPKLSMIFDRIIPQVDTEYVLFTSWVAGRLIHHPNIEQSRYVSHLFDRVVGWIRATGRRSRHLAAVHMLSAMSANDGSDIVTNFLQIQPLIWVLVSHPSAQLVRATSDAIFMFTRASIRYGRSELESNMNFFTIICSRLLSLESPNKIYSALTIMTQLVRANPDFYLQNFHYYFKMIKDACAHSQLLVKCAEFVTLTYFVFIDKNQFINNVAPYILTFMPLIYNEFPRDIAKALEIIICQCPEIYENKLDEFKKQIDDNTIDINSTAIIYAALFQAYGTKALPISEKLVDDTLNSPLTPEVGNFYINYAIINTKEFKVPLCNRLLTELQNTKTKSALVALDVISRMPSEALIDHETFLCLITDKITEHSEEYTSMIPKAMYHLTTSCESLSGSVIKKLFQLAIFDRSTAVRNAILEVLVSHASKELASPEYIKYLNIFTSDDSAIVRSKAFDLIAKISSINPLLISQITRDRILNYFFTLDNVPSIRTRVKIVRTMPQLIKAIGMTIKIYAPTIIDICSRHIIQDEERSKLNNFLEVSAADELFSVLCESLVLVAPVDANSMSKHVESVIPALCDYLRVTENRRLVLSCLKLLFVLLSPPASTMITRGMVPVILGACSKFLNVTRSRKARMNVLKVIGAIGILEVHQRPQIKPYEAPDFAEDNLSRQFYHPSRDNTGGVDDTLLMQQNTAEQCVTAIVSSSLLDIFKDDSLSDFHNDAALALVDVLSNPKMGVLPYFDKFVSRLLDVIEKASDSDLEQVYIPLYTRLIFSTGQNTSPFMDRSLDIISKRFNQKIALQCIDLIIAFATVMKDHFVKSSANTICLLIQCLDSEKYTNEKTSISVLEAFELFCEYQNDLSFLIISAVSDAIVCEQTFKNVRIAALRCFDKMVRSVDVFKDLGQIVRALEFCLTMNDQETVDTAMNLLYSLLLAQGIQFLINADLLLDLIKIRGLETPQLKNIINAVSHGQGYSNFSPIKSPASLPSKNRTINNQQQYIFFEESIIARVMSPALGYGIHLEQWLHSFILTTISGNPSPCIRACSTLASNHRPLAFALFRIAFYTCWKQISSEGRKQISETFLSILVAQENYESVVKELLELIFFMRKMDPPMNIPAQDIARACLRYGYDAFALYLQQNEMYSEKIVKPRTVLQLIEVYIQIGEWDNAHAIWKLYSTKIQAINKPETQAKLRLWDRVIPIYKEKFKRGDKSNSFRGLVKSLASMARWPELAELMPTFKTMQLADQRTTAPYFANAMMHLRRWDELDDALQPAPEDSMRCFSLKAISALHMKKYDIVDRIIDNAFSLLASRPITLWADNQQIHTDTMLVAQQLVEILEMKNWQLNEEMRPSIEEVWQERLTMAPRDFELWLKILGNRAAITGVHYDSYIDFFQLRSVTMDTKIHMNAFNAIFSEFTEDSDDALPQICHAVTQWSMGNRKEAIDKIKSLSDTVEGDLADRCHMLYASWLIETGESLNEFKEAYKQLQMMPAVSDCLLGNLKKSHRKVSNTTALFLPKAIVNAMKEDSINVNVLRMWSDVNTQLIELDPPNLPHYVTNAIDALSQCCTISPSFTDVVQLLNLFFDHANEGDIFEHTTNNCLNRLQPKLLLQASPQLLVQLSHPVPEVAQFVHDTVFNLLHEHYHELIFSVIVMKFSKDAGRSKAAFGLFDEFKKMNPSAHDEVFTIRKCLLRAAVTWYEKVIQRITDAFDHYALQQFDLMVDTLRSIVQMVKAPKCALHDQFKESYQVNIQALERILKVFSPHNQGQMNQLTLWCKSMQASLTEDIKKVRIIQLSSISKPLAEKTHFQLAVPGTYKPGKPIIRIQYFVGQFSVYMSKQQPKDVVIRGEDGNFYQYLVKGHEDLRLDERIMQFFRLINNFLKRETCFGAQVIQTMSVIPLSITNGLVQWVTGTDTLRSVVEQYRRLMNRDPIQEYLLTESLSYVSFDYMMPIQKYHVISKVMNIVPDTDIANFFYLKANTAEQWHKRTVTFSISAALTSMVGYVFGLGDRHPSNLLIDRFTGKLIHIDFGDCFERAAKRKFLPEVVPFRLTRMMCKAMGVTGPDGTFRDAFVNTSRVLRENKRILIMVLAIFVHEPLVDPKEHRSGSSNTKTDQMSFVGMTEVTGSVIDKGRVLLAEPRDKTTNTEMRARVNQKLSGTDFNENEALSVEDQATKLIKIATDPYNLAKMYSGWCPFW